jgi:hypothetical protein
VLPLAIDRRVTVAAARRSDDLLRLVSLQRGEQHLRLADIRPAAVRGWAAYAAGPMWALAQEGVEVGGLIAVIGGHAQVGVPVGTGSSAVAPPGGYAATMKIGGPGILGMIRNLYLLPSSPRRGTEETPAECAGRVRPGDEPGRGGAAGAPCRYRDRVRDPRRGRGLR